MTDKNAFGYRGTKLKCWFCGKNYFFLYQLEVLEIALDQCGPSAERRLAIVDKNTDLYLTSVRVFGTERKTLKLGMALFSQCIQL